MGRILSNEYMRTSPWSSCTLRSEVVLSDCLFAYGSSLESRSSFIEFAQGGWQALDGIGKSVVCPALSSVISCF